MRVPIPPALLADCLKLCLPENEQVQMVACQEELSQGVEGSDIEAKVANIKLPSSLLNAITEVICFCFYLFTCVY